MRRKNYPVIQQMRFSEAQSEWLRGEAARLGVSEAEVVRRALAAMQAERIPGGIAA